MTSEAPRQERSDGGRPGRAASLPGVFPVSEDCLELRTSASALQRGFKEGFEHLGITERKELHCSLAGRQWSAPALQAMHQPQLDQLRKLDPARRQRPPAAEPDPCADGVRLADRFTATMPRQRWLKELAGSLPLCQLESRAPLLELLARQSQLLRELAALQVPLLRASWLVKLLLTHAAIPGDGQERGAGADRQQLAKAWARLWQQQYGSLLKLPPSAEQALGAAAICDIPGIGRFLAEHCSQAAYSLLLLGQTQREGMTDAGALLAWLLQKARAEPVGSAGHALLLPLLDLLLPDAAQSQAHALEAAELCAHQLAGGGGSSSSSGIQNRSEAAAAGLSRAYGLCLQRLMRLAPHAFVGTDMLCWEPAGRLGCTGAVHVVVECGRPLPSGRAGSCAGRPRWRLQPEAQALGAAILERRAALASAVQAKVLGHSEAELMEDLEADVAQPAAEQLLERLRAKVEPWKQGCASAELVRMVCEWAAAAPALSIALAFGSISMDRANLEAQRSSAVRQAHALGLLAALSKAEGAARGLGQPLQPALVAWLDGLASGAELPCEFALRQAVSLLVKVAEAGLFCPGAYAHMLVARGWAPPAADASPAAAARAAVHLCVLEQLHPQLRLPSLDDAPGPSTPGGDAPLPAMSAALRRFAGTRAAVLARWRRHSPDAPEAAAPRCKRSSRSESCEASPRPPKLARLGSTSRESTPSGAPSSYASGLLRGDSLRRSASLFTADTGGTDPSGSLDAGAALASVQQAVQSSLAQPSLGGGSNAPQLLLTAANLRCWEQRLLLRWLLEQMRDDPARARKAAERDPGFLPWVVSLLEAAGGHVDALQWLVELLEAGDPRRGSGWAVQATAMLAARCAALPSSGLLPQLLDACLRPQQAEPTHGRLQALAAELLRALRSDVGVQAWWRAVEAAGGSGHARLRQLRTATESGAAAATDVPVRLAPAAAAQHRHQLSGAACSEGVSRALAACLQSPGYQQVKALVGNIEAGEAGSSSTQAAVHALVASAASAEVPGALPAAVQALLLLTARAASPHQLQALSASVLAACLAGAEPARACLLRAAVAAGLVDLADAMRAAVQQRPGAGSMAASQRLAWLLAPAPEGSSPFAAALAAELARWQRQLPKGTAWEAVSACWQSGGRDSDAAQAVLCSRSLAHALLRDPGWLQQQLAALPPQAGLQPHQAPMELALALVLGKHEASGAAAAPAAAGSEALSQLAARGGRLLSLASPAGQPLLALLLRCHLDEQVAAAALARGAAASEAVAAAATARAAQQGGGAGSAQISEEDKGFTSQVLAQLLVQADAAAGLAGLVWRLGKGLGSYLLQQVDWLLQDADALAGRRTLRAALRQRSAGLPLPLQAQEPGAAPADIFALEAGLVDVALVCLAHSPAAARLKFAEQVVAQLRRVGRVAVAQPAAGSGSGLAPAAASGEQQRTLPPADDPAALATAAGRLAWGAGRQLAAGPPEGVRLAVWLRLAVLLPMLPLVYGERQQALRAQLAAALQHLLTAPSIHAPLPPLTGSTAAQLGGRLELRALLAAAERRAGEPLFDRLLAVQKALLSGRWASWLRGSKTNLREVASFDCRHLQQELAAARLPLAVQAAVQATLTSLPLPPRAAPNARGTQPGLGASDAWALSDCAPQPPLPACRASQQELGALLRQGVLLPPPLARSLTPFHTAEDQ